MALVWAAAVRRDEPVVALGLEALDAVEPSGGFDVAWGLARVSAQLVGEGRRLTVGVSSDESDPEPAPPGERRSGELRVELVVGTDVSPGCTEGDVVETTELAASLLAAGSRADARGAFELWRPLDLERRAAVTCELAGIAVLALAEEIIPRVPAEGDA